MAYIESGDYDLAVAQLQAVQPGTPWYFLANTNLCVECGGELVCNEIEILNMFYEVGAFCDNEKCKRYMILVA